jgi:hypothetical protein
LPITEKWEVPAVHRLEDADFSAIDVVAISVPTAQNAVVLSKLIQIAPHVTIVIDTPIAWSRSEFIACSRLLSKFSKVLVTEDYMNFPSFTLLRKAAMDGLIGSMRATTLNSIGYLYHGLALIRSFADFAKASRTWKGDAGWISKVVGYGFSDNYRGCVIGPYRQQTGSGIMIEGSKGALSDYPGDAKFGTPDRPVHILNRHESEGRTTGFSIAGVEDRYSVDLPEMTAMHGMPFADKSDLNLQRGSGLMQVFRALNDPANINHRYGYKNAFYDSFVSRLAGRPMFKFDPMTLVGSDAVTAAASFLGR